MNPTQLAAILALAENGLANGLRLYKFIAANVPNAKPLEDILSDADATFAQVQQTAQAEIDKAKS